MSQERSSTSARHQAWLTVLAGLEQVDEATWRAAQEWEDEKLLEALRGPDREDARRAVGLYAEAIRRGLTIPGVEEFTGKLGSWPDRNLTDALEVYAGEYELEQQAALLAEVRRRGLVLADPARHKDPKVLKILLAFVFIAGLAVAILAGRSYFTWDEVSLGKIGTVIVLAALIFRWVFRPIVDRLRAATQGGGEAM